MGRGRVVGNACLVGRVDDAIAFDTRVLLATALEVARAGFPLVLVLVLDPLVVVADCECACPDVVSGFSFTVGGAGLVLGVGDSFAITVPVTGETE
jgi:hypothetical protein